MNGRTAIIAMGIFFGAVLCAPQGAYALSSTEVADLNSTLSQHAARTTTITEEFKYDLKHPDGLTVMYNGHRGSKVEPCGCRALNLGGIDKEAAMIQTIRGKNPNALLLDTGGFFREFTDPSIRLQTWYLMDAMSHLGVQAVNVGFPDLRQGLAALKDFETRFKLPFISANIVDEQTGEPMFAPYKTFTATTATGPIKVAVVGVTAPNRDVSRGGVGQGGVGAGLDEKATTSTQPQLNAQPPTAGRWMIAESNGNVPWMPYDVHSAASANLPGGGSSAPAASGGNDSAMEFAVKGGDSFTSATVTPYRVKDPLVAAINAGNRLKPDNDLLILLAFVSYDTAIKMAPSLAQYDVIIAADYVEHTEPARPMAGGPLVIGGEYDGKYLGLIEVPVAGGKPGPADSERLPVLQTIKPLPEYTHYINAFTSQTENLPVDKPAQVYEKIYSGATSCRSCHVDAYTQWKTHHHSRAMKALVDKNMHFNPDCLKCHTVAYKMPGGFTDLRVTANLANVQCEVCHGPGEAHAKEMRAAEALKREGKPIPAPVETMKMTWDQNFCMQCHDPANDPHFDFEKDIQRVRHKNPAAPRERPTTMSLDM